MNRTIYQKGFEMKKTIAVLFVSASIAATAMPSQAQAHRVSWASTWEAIVWSNWGGLCGQGLNWQCRGESMNAIRQEATGEHSRWVLGQFREIHTLPWGPPWRHCDVLTRFSHRQLAEVAYKRC